MTGVSAAILAGGLGTRLRSVVADRPKVLAPVAGRPFLTHLLDRLAAAGVGETLLLVGHGADQVRDALGETYRGTRLRYSAEPEPLGTGGAIRYVLPQVRTETVLVLNGDSYCQVDLAAFHNFHRAGGYAASLVLTHVENAARFGRVVVNDDRVVRFEEKCPTPAPGRINAGVYLLNRALLEAVPAGRPASLERDLLPNWVAAGLVGGFAAGGRFIDIGVPESYAAAEAFFAAEPPS
ncbi:MAG: nucleotidyltransferase family protein [Gemmataceae bacterium]|nr:nucleotidyltransferase family protein [Gemmataceae bacterium]